jgi:hypothetical protein
MIYVELRNSGRENEEPNRKFGGKHAKQGDELL